MKTGDANEHLNRIAVVGCGHVGATSAYSLILAGVAREVVLIDSNQELAEGEAMDLQHAAALSRPVRVWAGDYSEAARSFNSRHRRRIGKPARRNAPRLVRQKRSGSCASACVTCSPQDSTVSC